MRRTCSCVRSRPSPRKRICSSASRCRCVSSAAGEEVPGCCAMSRPSVTSHRCVRAGRSRASWRPTTSAPTWSSSTGPGRAGRCWSRRSSPVSWRAASGLPVPELVTVELDPALGASEPDQEVQELLRASPGMNLGMDFLPGALDLDPKAFPVDPAFAGRVLWFDALVGNVDRSWRNTNMLFWHGSPYLIDHGATLTFQHAWSAAEGWVGRAYDRRGPRPARLPVPISTPPTRHSRRWSPPELRARGRRRGARALARGRAGLRRAGRRARGVRRAAPRPPGRTRGVAARRAGGSGSAGRRCRAARHARAQAALLGCGGSGR